MEQLLKFDLNNLRSNLLRDIKGKENYKGEQIGLQLFTNVLEIAEGKDIRMVFEKFDGIDAALVRNSLDEVVTNALKTNPELKKLIAAFIQMLEITLGLGNYY